MHCRSNGWRTHWCRVAKCKAARGVSPTFEMDIAVNIAVGSSIQIALFVAPLLVFLSSVIGPQPLDLVFTSFEVLAIVLSVFFIASSRRTESRTGWRASSYSRSMRSWVLRSIFFPEGLAGDAGSAQPRPKDAFGTWL